MFSREYSQRWSVFLVTKCQQSHELLPVSTSHSLKGQTGSAVSLDLAANARLGVTSQRVGS